MIECELCGVSAPSDELPLTWVMTLERGLITHYCDRCARNNVRNIEGRLDRTYW